MHAEASSTNKPTVLTCQVTHWEISTRQGLDEAHISDFRFHDLRHTCASYLATHGASVIEIAEVLGHREVRMAKRYAHLTLQHKNNVIKRIVLEQGL